MFADDAPDADGPDTLRRTPPLAPHLASRGYVVAVVRAAPSVGGRLSVQEGKLALRWLKAQHATFQLQPDAVGVMGGRLAALVGLGSGVAALGDWAPGWLDAGTRAAALVLASVPGSNEARALDASLSGCAIVEPCDDCEAEASAALLNCTAATCASADPLNYASSDDPPTLLIAGDDDCMVPVAGMRRLAEGLQSVGVAAQWQVVPGRVRPDDLARTPTRQIDVETFFDAQLRGCRPLPSPVPLLTAAELDRMLTARPQPKKKPPKKDEPPKPKPAERPDRQVVEIPPPANQAPPKDARFLSEYNSTVEREQVSRNKQAPTPRVVKSELRKLGKGDERSGDAPQKPTRRSGKKQPNRKAIAKRPGDAPHKGDQPGPKAKPKPIAQSKPKDKPAVELTPGDGPFAHEKPAVAKAEDTPGGGGTPGGATAPDNWRQLLPSLGPEELARKDGSIDHIDDMAEGNGTFLNTAEYKHAWFFNRVKQGVQQNWRAVDVHRRHDPYGRVYGVRDRRTVLQVTLNPDGTLDDLFVQQDSGVSFLDDAALRAFRQAQPFPNPPEALRDADGRIRFKFAFFLEIGGRGMRMFRSR
jgi:TonB family protein